MADPRSYYEQLLIPPYQEWQRRPYEAWLAQAAVQNADIMAERLAKHLGVIPIEYRRHLRDQCPEFGWIWDVAEGIKHVKLGRIDAKVSHVDQVAPSRAIADWKTIASVQSLAQHVVFIVTDNDGDRRSLDGLMEVVMPMFERLLAQHKL